MRLGGLGVICGRVGWALFFRPHDIKKEVFNLVYHLKQSVKDVMAWPSRMRGKFWKMTLDQYEFEKNSKGD